MKNKNLKISFCTVCMNRLHHLKETLPKNIKDNLDYENIEFVVLNYNSTDGMDAWIKTEMKEFLDIGVLKYYHTEEPKNFHMTHSKNVAAKLGTGDILCNVDADNFTGSGFADYINTVFKNDQDIFLAVNKNMTQKDCFGRICIIKEDFLILRGYDEQMNGYGFDDYDLWNRLELLGRKFKYIEDNSYLKALTHTDSERIENEYNPKGIKRIYVRFINHAISELLYLFEKRNFFIGKIVINRLINSESTDNIFVENRVFEYSNSLFNDTWEIGKWDNTKNGIELFINDNSKVELINKEHGKLGALNTSELKEFYPIFEKTIFNDMVMFFSQISNRIIMKRNLKAKKVSVNKNSFGKVNLLAL
ncbi:glycosyltransferase [Algibacter pacificus]|uniref:glycosyltransferase n=1 Tax=Algibacter pacificus TaxID=2599389 RepID=UPI0011C6ED3D|nr:glycosyltransferase family A protein [Algibacter pacificus]